MNLNKNFKVRFLDLKANFLNLYKKENIYDLYFLTFFYTIGISLGYLNLINIHLFFFCLFLIFIFLLVLKRKLKKIITYFIIFLFGFLNFTFSNNNRDLNYKNFKNLNLKGKVENILQKKKNCYIFFNTKINNSNKTLRLKIDCDKINFKTKDYLDLNVDLFKFDRKNLELNKTFNFYAKFNKIYSYGNILNINSIKVSNFNIFKYIEWFRFKEIQKIRESFKDDRGAGFIIALLMGNSYLMNDEDVYNVRHIGIAHLIAISGLHMSIMLFIFYYGIRKLIAFFPRIALFYDSKKIAAILSVVFCYFYLSLSGYAISATRSFIMISSTLIGVFLDTKTSSMRNLFLSFLAISFYDPFTIFHPSFQLSFIAVISLISFYNYFNQESDFLFIIKKSNRFYSWFFSILLTEIATTFATLFFEMYHFGQFILLGMFSNFIIIPLVEFLILPFSFLGFIPFFGNIFYFFVIKLSNVMFLFVDYFSKIPFVCLRFERINEFELVLSILGLLILFLMRTKLRFLGFVLILFSSFLYIIRPKQKFLILNDIMVYKTKKECIFNMKIKNNLLKASIENYFCQNKEIKINENLKDDNFFKIDRNFNSYKFKDKMIIIYNDNSFKIFD